MKKLTLCMLLALSFVAAADPKPGTEAKAWLDLQKSGKSASKEDRPMSGDVAGKAYDRYAQSFDNQIPATYSRDSISGNQGGGSSSK